MQDHEALQELTGAYALGTLSDAERRQFVAHLKECPECTAESRDFAAVAARLGELVEQRDPPAHLRARVMALVEGETPTRQRAPAPAWLLVAASLALVAVSGYAMMLRGRVSVLETEVREARQRAASVEQQVAGLRQAVSETPRIADVLAAADVARIDLAGQPAAPRAAGRAFWSKSRGLVFTATNLPALPSGKVYQLWAVTADAKISAGLVAVDETGHATAVSATSPDLRPVAIALTIEPAGGVRSPTGAMYLVGTL